MELTWDFYEPDEGDKCVVYTCEFLDHAFGELGVSLKDEYAYGYPPKLQECIEGDTIYPATFSDFWEAVEWVEGEVRKFLEELKEEMNK